MIAIAKAVSYGVNDLRYITGESNKKETPGEDFQNTRQPLAIQDGRIRNMECYAASPGAIPKTQELRYHHSYQSLS